MQRRFISPATLAAAAAVALLFGAAAREPSAARAQSTVVVSMAGNQFAPGTITVAAGGVVTWVNNEDPSALDNLHDVIASDYATFLSDYISPGDTFSQEFDTPGTYTYLCDLHTDMQGTIVVE
ncbi:MAG TPA: cupredoxin domain-containing protein [Dehalococcoidia bacterium]|nr:cupredoxin domain-containing protein [Dehalococcoidia bacterium]